MEEKFSVKSLVKVFNEIFYEKQEKIEILQARIKIKDEEIEELKAFNDYYKNKYEVNSRIENKDTLGGTIEDTAKPF